MTCRCDAHYPGCNHSIPCLSEDPSDTSPHYCFYCNERRIDYIIDRFQTILAQLEERQP